MTSTNVIQEKTKILNETVQKVRLEAGLYKFVVDGCKELIIVSERNASMALVTIEGRKPLEKITVLSSRVTFLSNVKTKSLVLKSSNIVTKNVELLGLRDLEMKMSTLLFYSGHKYMLSTQTADLMSSEIKVYDSDFYSHYLDIKNGSRVCVISGEKVCNVEIQQLMKDRSSFLVFPTESKIRKKVNEGGMLYA